MAKEFHVYSKLSCSQNYTIYAPAKEGQQGTPHVKEKSVLINGGANVVDKTALTTPQGVVTTINEEQKAVLDACNMCQRHIKAGYIKIEDKNHSVESVVKGMEEKDLSAPITPADHKEADVK